MQLSGSSFLKPQEFFLKEPKHQSQGLQQSGRWGKEYNRVETFKDGVALTVQCTVCWINGKGRDGLG